MTDGVLGGITGGPGLVVLGIWELLVCSVGVGCKFVFMKFIP